MLSAHPHSRGENMRTSIFMCSAGGSSPLTRGKLEVVAYVRVVVGLIPAYTGKTVRRRHALRSRRVPPHSRGENAAVSCASYVCTGSSPLARENIDAWELPERHVGSSPLTRGKPDLCPNLEVRLRLIPTQAGKTLTRRFRVLSARPHPHSREENVMILVLNCLVAGSSPLTRGKRIHCSSQRHQPGLIPSLMGKT